MKDALTEGAGSATIAPTSSRVRGSSLTQGLAQASARALLAPESPERARYSHMLSTPSSAVAGSFRRTVRTSQRMFESSSRAMAKRRAPRSSGANSG
jgi:hypothetical protein